MYNIFPDDYWVMTLIVLTPATLFASFVDLRQRRVPNVLNAVLAIAGIGVQFHYHGASGIHSAAAGALVGLGLLLIPWLMYAMGAGDVKLLAAIGTWLGPALTLYSFIAGAIIGGAIGGVMIVANRRAKTASANLDVIFHKLAHFKTAFSEYGSVKSFGDKTMLLPYGIPLTIGTLIILWGQYFQWWPH